MGLTYFKRYKMEIRLSQLDLRPLELDGRVELKPWSNALIAEHALVKWESFRSEIDAHVFPCLGEKEGCARLMRQISSRPNFVPEATWLACHQTPTTWIACGTVQGLMVSPREGAIQNLGVHPDYRDQGIGRALLARALEGFRAVGCTHAQLEVTVQNTAAVRLYERVGFRRIETLFKVADVIYA
ncbi:MAG: GNAT family N-acetyltransferase [Pirellulaceae bacterium]|nr:GNAT family N-acetyltransferase [Pirellulaceae bacterium]